MSLDNITVALAGNPNVGKSTLFNNLTGLNQHTGNWAGKTVSTAMGKCKYKDKTFTFCDIPGTYSLDCRSKEEEVARDYICFGEHDLCVVVCGASTLERNLNLVLQVLEVTPKVVVCVNLMDEAKYKGIEVDLKKLEALLGVPVVGTIARNKKSAYRLMPVLYDFSLSGTNKICSVKYGTELENAISKMSEVLSVHKYGDLPVRWLSTKLIAGDNQSLKAVEEHLGYSLLSLDGVCQTLEEVWQELSGAGYTKEKISHEISALTVTRASQISELCVKGRERAYSTLDRGLDKIFTSKLLGFPIMLCLLCLVFWITLKGANYPSEWLSDVLFGFEDNLLWLFNAIGFPSVITDMLVFGVYRVLSWVVSVMLPPMAIFFPLFTLLEDSGYLPRIAYNLDKPFCKCCACGKQAMTMCMGFGCNAAAIVGCRIIDSPRERLVAMLTNSFVPCNGRFPTLAAIISMFFVGAGTFAFGGLAQAAILTLLIAFSVLCTFGATFLLSKTMLKGQSSAFTIELPSYRKPQFLKVLTRSLFDRTLFVLGRSVCVAAPAGLVIWLLANLDVGDSSLLSICCNALEPVGYIMGLDGVILMAFILGFPANEIVLPIAVMSYLANSTISQLPSLYETKALLAANGWTPLTAVCMLIFMLIHFPCSTSILSIKKETGSFWWTAVAFLLPTLFGAALCVLTAFVGRSFLCL